MAHYTIRSPMYDTIEALNQFANELEAKRQQKELADLMGKMLNSTIPTPQEESWYKEPQQPVREASPWNRVNGDQRIINFPGNPMSGPSAINPDAQRPRSNEFNFMDAMRMLLQNPDTVAKAGGLGAVLDSLTPVQNAYSDDRRLGLEQQRVGFESQRVANDTRSTDAAIEHNKQLLSLKKQELAQEVEKMHFDNEMEKRRLQLEIMNTNSLSELRKIQGQYNIALAKQAEAGARYTDARTRAMEQETTPDPVYINIPVKDKDGNLVQVDARNWTPSQWESYINMQTSLVDGVTEKSLQDSAFSKWSSNPQSPMLTTEEAAAFLKLRTPEELGYETYAEAFQALTSLSKLGDEEDFLSNSWLQQNGFKW